MTPNFANFMNAPSAVKPSEFVRMIESQRKDVLRMMSNPRDFLSMVQKSFDALQMEPATGKRSRDEIKQPARQQYRTYFAALQKQLLQTGKPPAQLALKKDDLYVLKDFLDQCGYDKKDVDRCIIHLLHQQTTGKVNLSDFFDHMEKVGPPRKRDESAVVMDASTVCHVESVLNGFGLSPKQTEQILLHARTADGGLDMGKLAGRLNRFSRQQNGKSINLSALKPNHRGIRALADFGIDAGDEKAAGSVSLETFITALEKAVDRSAGRMTAGAALQPKMSEATDLRASSAADDAGRHPVNFWINAGNLQKGASTMPDAIRGTIEQIAAKAMAVDSENPASLASVATVSKFKQAKASADKITDRNDKGVMGAPKSPTFVAESGDPVPKHPAKPANPADVLPHAVKPDAAIETQRHFTDVGGLKTGAENKPVVNPVNFTSHPSATTDGAVAKQPPANPVPLYLVDQLSSQISRSVQKGDGIVKLRLKPPELGAVRLEMEMSDNVLKLGVVAENRTVKELLMSHLHELRETLMEQGVKLEKLDVQIQEDFNQSLSDFDEHLSERFGPNENGKERSAALAEDNGISGEINDDGSLPDGEYLLNVRA